MVEREMFQNQEPEKLPMTFRVGMVGLMFLALIVGAWVTHRAGVRHHAQAVAAEEKIAAEQKVERDWLTQTAAHLYALTQDMLAADQERTDILKRGTKFACPNRQCPKPLSAKDQKAYDAASEKGLQLAREYEALLPEYNRHWQAYQGPWPSEPRPSKNPSQKKVGLNLEVG